MNILNTIRDYAERDPERVAVINGTQKLTYGQLWEYSGRLAGWMLHREKSREPVAVYGHKHPWMIVCFLACARAGRAYCPIDISVPDARVNLILKSLPSGFVLTTEPMQADAQNKQVLTKEDLGAIIRPEAEKEFSDSPKEDLWVKGEETYYIIFTSGSTGTPKGVQITADCLNHYLDWSLELGNSRKQKEGQVFLNQAPFSFDLSVMDLYTSLASGGTLFCLEKAVQSDYRALMQSLKESGANVWVSTPSFAEVCLSEPSFSADMLPQMQVFLFCGEALGNRTARKLQERFPNSCVVNTYGPTESTVAVTDVLVTREVEQQENPLPVGRAKPGTTIEIRDEEGKILPEGEKGEIIIIGDTVSTGYYGRPDLTEKSFFVVDSESGREEMLRAGVFSKADNPAALIRGYHTGDKGYLKDGMLYYCGRIDLQIKLHGYRIELEDIENNIRRLPWIEHAVVVPNSRGGRVTSLTAYVVMRDGVPDEAHTGEAVQKMRDELQQFLPDYMIPKKTVFLDQMPMTNNGKADRKLLGGKC